MLSVNAHLFESCCSKAINTQHKSSSSYEGSRHKQNMPMKLRNCAQDESDHRKPYKALYQCQISQTTATFIPIYMIHLNPIGSIKPPFLKHSMNNANANPPHAPMKYLAACQKKMAIPPPIIPAIAEASTNKPRSV